MTDSTSIPDGLLPVTQADIDAVKRFHNESARWMLDAIKNGDPIGEERDLSHPIYQAFARHRISTQAPNDAVGEIPQEALEALRNGQQQIDRDGTFVGVSRQALDEVLAALAKFEPEA